VICSDHGSHIHPNGQCTTELVLNLVRLRRGEQYSRYGSNDDTRDGTGSHVAWIPTLPADATEVEALFRADWDYDTDPSREAMTWMRLVREEVAEAFAADDPNTLFGELLDVAALCVSWMECLSERDVPKQMSITDLIARDRA